MNKTDYSMSRPLVSVCVPVYGVEPYIERCACSIFNQTYSDWEAVFVDDCSPDRSIHLLEQVISSYKFPNGKVRILHHGWNRGIAAARNSAVEAAKGDFIFWVDSDDWIESDALEILVRRQVETKADIVSGNAACHTKDGEFILGFPEYQKGRDMAIKMVEITIDHTLWRRLIRRSLYVDYGIQAPEGINWGEDCHLMSRLAFFASRVSKVDNVIYHYNQVNEESYSHRLNRRRFDYVKFHSETEVYHILEEFFRYRDAEIYERVLEILNGYLDTNRLLAIKTLKWKAYKMVRMESNPDTLPSVFLMYLRDIFIEICLKFKRLSIRCFKLLKISVSQTSSLRTSWMRSRSNKLEKY